MRPAQKRNRKQNHFRRERFLEANHNFAIYPSYFSDERREYYDGSIESTDIIIDWGSVSQVWYNTNKQYDCPVCLYPPVCPRIIPCGHVICWPCVYRYFSTRKNKSMVVITKQNAPCPVCQIQVELKDFRSVTLIHQEKYTISQIAKFVLLKRQKTSAIIELSNEQTDFSDIQNIYRIPSTTGKSAPYNRVSLALDLSILQREESELELGIKEAISSGDEAQSLLDAKELWEQYQEIALQRIYVPPSILPNDDPRPNKTAEYYHFYVLENGRHIYLHQISFRWLMKQFIDASNFPEVIEGPIIDIEEEICQDEMSRKRFKFLSHLPIGCNFQFAVIDLSSVLTEENHQGYLSDIHHRNQTKNNEKIQKDKYEERQILRSMKNKERRSYNDAEVTYAMLEGLPLPVSQATLFERWNNMTHISNDPTNFPSLPSSEQDSTISSSEKPEPPISSSVPGWSGKSLIEMEKEERRKNTKDYQFPELPSYDTPIIMKPSTKSQWVTLGSPKNMASPPRNPPVSRSPNSPQIITSPTLPNTTSPRTTTTPPTPTKIIPSISPIHIPTTTSTRTTSTPTASTPPGTGRGLAHSPKIISVPPSSTGRGTKIAK